MARRTQGEIAQLCWQMYEVLEADHPQSTRHVFYRMTDPTLAEPVEKTEGGYVTVQRQLVQMRRRGLIPYGWISDATRAGYFVETFDSPAEAVEAWASYYRRNYWSAAPVYVEVWCESRSIAGVIRQLCADLAVPLYPAAGFASDTLIWSAAEHIKAVAADRAVEIFYIGDWDAAGTLIDIDIERKLRQHLGDQIGYRLEFTRLAITRQQIDMMGLPTKPAKDRRGGFEGDTVEAEAMPAATLRQLLRGAIEELMNPRELAVMEAAEQNERGFLERLARHLRKS